MHKKKTPQIFFLLVTISLLFFTVLAGCKPQLSLTFQQPKLVIEPESLEGEEKEIAAAFEAAIAGREDVLSFLIFNVEIDHIVISSDRRTALIWYSLSDPETEIVISTEAGLAIAQKSPSEESGAWIVTLQAESNWDETLLAVPPEILDDEIRARYASKNQPVPHAHKVYGGYRLPWAPGEAKRLTGSVGHVYLYKTCPSTCLYAFDFSDGTMWPILAAKAGRVRYAVWHHPNGNTKHSNYIVIEDNTTYPTTYQVYTHLAQDSIPPELRRPGAPVVQGQKIGITDDTGVSTGHHLHFHVHTNPGSYWGTSVDITFEDVKVNGGRPRTCYEAKLFPSLGKQCQSGDFYISGNNDLYIPEGGISGPADGTTIEEQSIMIDAWAKDDLGIQSLQVMLNYAGEWLLVGDRVARENIQTHIDLCALEVPDGHFFVALQITDTAGKQTPGLPGLITLQKSFTCPLPPPECEVNDDQVGIFALPELQGECVLLDPGQHTASEIFQENIQKIGSLQLGRNVIVRFYNNNDEKIYTSSTLNTIDLEPETISSIRIEEKPPKPQIPEILITNQGINTQITAFDKLVIVWEQQHSSYQYRMQIAQGEELIRKLDWTVSEKWEVGNLPPGDYELYVDVHNIVGDTSAVIPFTILEYTPLPVTQLHPMQPDQQTTSLPISWEITSGDDEVQYVEIRYRENNGEWQVLQATFPPQIKKTWFFGNPGSRYDFEIRSIDINGNEETFHSDPQTTVRIDDACQSDANDQKPGRNDSSGSAINISPGKIYEYNFCGQQDTDWVSFSADEGSIYKILIRPTIESVGVSLNLLSNNASERLLSSHTQIPGESTQIVWSAPKTGFYYLELLPYDPRLFGSDTHYELEIIEVVQLHPTGFLAAIFLPLFWSLYKLGKKVISGLKLTQ